MKQGIQIRQSVLVSAVLLAVLFLLPLAVIMPFQTEPHTEAEEQKTETLPPVRRELDAETTLRVLQGEQVTEMSLGEYLAGVVRAEMPASFEQEALKAQAVAARTYTLYQIKNGGRHGDAAEICTESTCCQAYLDQETARKNWGEQAEVYEEKIGSAVADTDGEVILYGGAPILAAFHSSSSGLTRAAGEVWSSDLPYLQPVTSLEAGEVVPDYYSRVEFSEELFREKVSSACGQADFSGTVDSWLKNAVTDAAGNVKTVEVGGVTVRGSEVRRILGLRSACFTWEIQAGKLVFFVTGSGHGVGLSQYGANQMAAEGSDYRDILTHYYTDVTVAPWQTPSQFD